VLRISRKVNGPKHPFTLSAMDNLAGQYGEVGRRDEALKLAEELLSLSRKVNGPEHPSTLVYMGDAADSYCGVGRLDEALKLREEVLTLSREVNGPEHPFTLEAMTALASLHAQSVRWAEAATNLTRAIELNPSNNLSWFFLGVIYVQTGQLDAYRQNCRKSLERFSQTTDPITADTIAKDCLILPDSGANLDTVSKMADTAVARGQDSRYFAWFQSDKGLAEYRQGRFASAAKWMGLVLSYSGAIYTRRHNYLRISTPDGRAALLRRLDQGEAAAPPYQGHAQSLKTLSI
jgi:tetratricopeptide (TPR) repeat protein